MMLALLLPLFLGCGPSDDPTDDTGGSGGPQATRGLPEGSSRWEGAFEAGGMSFAVALDLANSGGDLSGVVTIVDDGITPAQFAGSSYSVTGTHEPFSGRVALAPQDWIEEPSVAVELLGLSAVYDPTSDTLAGTVADYASGVDNNLEGGPGSLSRVSGDGAPTVEGDLALALPTGSTAFAGTHQCTGSEREIAGTITFDGEGAVSGELSFGDLTLAENAHTFEFTGVHNPSTGGITLVPGLYTETDGAYAAFFVEALLDPQENGFFGEGRVNVGSCPPDLWKAWF